MNHLTHYTKKRTQPSDTGIPRPDEILQRIAARLPFLKNIFKYLLHKVYKPYIMFTPYKEIRRLP
jgi:hypothetical protein